MYPILILGAAAASLFLMGCGKREEKENSPPPLPSSSPIPPKPTYKTDFGGDLKVPRIFQELKKRGVSDEAFDQGCPQWLFKDNRFSESKILGGGDHIQQSCEVYEYLFNHPDTHPDLAEEVAGKPLPWSLDDRDPSTPLDEKARLRVKETARFLDALLEKRGMKAGSRDYEEKKILGLFALAALPPNHWEEKYGSSKEASEFAKVFKKQISDLEERLSRSGMGELYPYLKSGGGGFATFSNFDMEHTALKAMELEEGDCTELSKILYAVLKLAGFKPNFFMVDPKTSSDPLLQEMARKLPFYMHVGIELPLLGERRRLDPSFLNPEANYSSAMPMSLRQYLSFDLTNRGNMEGFLKRSDEAEKAYDWAVEIDSKNAFAFHNRGFLKTSKNDMRAYEEGMKDFDRALESNPSIPMLFYSRGLAWTRTRQHQKAIADFDRAIRMDGTVPVFHYDRGVSRAYVGSFQESLQDFAAYLKSSPPEGASRVHAFLKDISEARWNHPSFAAAVPALERELRIKPSDLDFQWSLSLLEWEMGEQSEGKRRLQKSLLKIPTAPLSVNTTRFLEAHLQMLPAELRQSAEIESQRRRLKIP